MNTNRVVTLNKVDGKGKRKVVAQGGGRQRTLVVDPSKSSAQNHGAVAGLVADVLGWKKTDHIRHTEKPDGTWVFDRDTTVTHAQALLASAGREG